MWIMIAGPYSAPTREGRAENLRRLNEAAYEVWCRGHLPVIGVNAGLPIAEAAGDRADAYTLIMSISLALADRCDALFLVASSPGADREAERIRARGLPVFTDLAAVPRSPADVDPAPRPNPDPDGKPVPA